MCHIHVHLFVGFCFGFCFLFFLFFVLSSHSTISHSFRDVMNADDVLHILTYARHLWPLSSEGSLAWHTYCNTGLYFIFFISENLCHSHLLPSVYRLRSVPTRDRSSISRMRGQRSTCTPPRRLHVRTWKLVISLGLIISVNFYLKTL